MKGQKKSPFPLLRVLAGFVVVLSMAIAYGCGSGGGGESGATPVTIIGTFWDAEVDGITYNANPSGQTGTTQNAGKFVCKADDTVGFFVGDVFLGQTTCKKNVTLLDLVPGATDETNPVVTNIARFLQSLDSDLDPSNGININSDTVAEVMGRPIDIVNPELSFDNDADLQALFIMLGVTPVTSNEAQSHLRNTLLMLPGDSTVGGDPGDSTVGGDPGPDCFPGNQNASNTCTAVYTVTQQMSAKEVISTIEGVMPGDTILVEPGTYHARILLYKDGVTLKAADPNNKPLFDYSGQPISSWPGTLSNWHNHYGIEIQADNVLIENINCKGAKATDGAGACVMNGPLGFVAEPAGVGTQTNNVTIRGMEISESDDGIGSVGFNFLIDDCEVHNNGNLGGVRPRHNIYVHGGTLTIRNSNFYAATQGENVHSRAKTTIIEDSIMGPVYSNYPLGMYTDKADQPKDGTPFTQTFIVRNTTIDARRPDGGNTVKVIAAMNSNAYAGLTQNIELYNNKYLGANNDNASIVQLVRGDGHVSMGLISSGNDWSAFNGTRFLYLSSGQNPYDGFYNINVTDFNDSSLPTNN